jgi:putative ABC transport system ATP-binding protein
MVKIEQLAFHYKQRKICTPVLDIPSLQIKENHKTMIYGKNGYGKSTLLNLIAGILLPNKGTIHINRQSIG